MQASNRFVERQISHTCDWEGGEKQPWAATNNHDTERQGPRATPGARCDVLVPQFLGIVKKLKSRFPTLCVDYTSVP